MYLTQVAAFDLYVYMCVCLTDYFSDIVSLHAEMKVYQWLWHDIEQTFIDFTIDTSLKVICLHCIVVLIILSTKIHQCYMYIVFSGLHKMRIQ